MSLPWQKKLQQSACESSYELSLFYDHVFAMTLGVLFFVVAFLILMVLDSGPVSRNFNEHSVLELVWTSVPFMILVLLAVPSLSLLYSLEYFKEPDMTMKCVGNQWYWNYELEPSHENPDVFFSFDSYMVGGDDLKKGDFSLSEVDSSLVIPVSLNMSFMVSSNDVIHSFTVPSFGFKIDAVPGSLNQVYTNSLSVGLFTGGCSEICGAQHSFMPVSVEAVSVKNFTGWLSLAKEEVDDVFC